MNHTCVSYLFIYLFLKNQLARENAIITIERIRLHGVGNLKNRPPSFIIACRPGVETFDTVYTLDAESVDCTVFHLI